MGDEERVPEGGRGSARPARRKRASALAIQELRQRFRRLHEEWVPILGLQDWYDQSYVESEGDGKTWAEAEVQWEYRCFRIRYYLDSLTLPDDRFEWIVVHELVHVMTAPLRELAGELIEQLDEEEDSATVVRWAASLHDERVTSEIASALLRARRQNVAKMVT